jgi:hypothetical protein
MTCKLGVGGYRSRPKSAPCRSRSGSAPVRGSHWTKPMRQPQLTALPGTDPEPDGGVAAHVDVIGMSTSAAQASATAGSQPAGGVASAMPFWISCPAKSGQRSRSRPATRHGLPKPLADHRRDEMRRVNQCGSPSSGQAVTISKPARGPSRSVSQAFGSGMTNGSNRAVRCCCPRPVGR